MPLRVKRIRESTQGTLAMAYHSGSRGVSMARELPILPSTAQPTEGTSAEAVIYSRVFCKE